MLWFIISAEAWREEGRPPPHGGPPALAPDIDLLLEQLKKMGGQWEYEQNPYLTPLGDIEDSHGGLRPPGRPPSESELGRPWEEGGFGGGGFGGLLEGDIRDMIDRLKRGGAKKKKKKGKRDERDPTDDHGSWWLNPVIAPLVYPWDRPVLNLKTDARGRFVSDYGGALIAFDVEVTVDE